MCCIVALLIDECVLCYLYIYYLVYVNFIRYVVLFCFQGDFLTSGQDN